MEKTAVLPPIKGKVNEIIEISIPSNPTTGYACTLSTMPDCLYLVSSDYDPNQPQLAGSGGSQVFKFVAVAKGESSVQFSDVKFSHPLEILPQNPMQKRFVIIE